LDAPTADVRTSDAALDGVQVLDVLSISKCFSASANWVVLLIFIAQLHANILMTISLMLLFV
jgi:hypothetical protein